MNLQSPLAYSVLVYLYSTLAEPNQVRSTPSYAPETQLGTLHSSHSKYTRYEPYLPTPILVYVRSIATDKIMCTELVQSKEHNVSKSTRWSHHIYDFGFSVSVGKLLINKN